MATLYDEVSYPSRAFFQTHPRRLAVAPALFGLPFAAIDAARVLEIGCGDGANIIPMALANPGMRVTGFDLAQTPIAHGQSVIQRLGLTNITLTAQNILHASPQALGQFDYIIAHGVYAWVPGPVREALMALIAGCLAADGVAFVSYNALPGCRVRQMVRDALLFHLRTVDGSEARLREAVGFLGLLAQARPEPSSAEAAMADHARSLLERDPHILFHDELGDSFEPLHLYEVAEHAGRHGLAYLADASGPTWREELFPTSLGQTARALAGGDPVALHQYLDLFIARPFRQSLLHWRPDKLDRTVDPLRMNALYAAAQVTVMGDFDPAPGVSVKFGLGPGRSIAVDDSQIKAALMMMAEAWPRAAAVIDMPQGGDAPEALLQLFTAGHIHLQVGASPICLDPGEHPVASSLARLQAASPRGDLTSLDHSVVQLEDAAGRHFLQLLDGTRSRTDLAADMARFLAIDPADVAAEVGPHLSRLAKLSLLVS